MCSIWKFCGSEGFLAAWHTLKKSLIREPKRKRTVAENAETVSVMPASIALRRTLASPQQSGKSFAHRDLSGGQESPSYVLLMCRL